MVVLIVLLLNVGGDEDSVAVVAGVFFIMAEWLGGSDKDSADGGKCIGGGGVVTFLYKNI